MLWLRARLTPRLISPPHPCLSELTLPSQDTVGPSWTSLSVFAKIHSVASKETLTQESLQRHLGSSLVVRGVRTRHFHCYGPDSVPPWGTKVLQATWQKKKKRTLSIPHTNSKGRTVSRAINLIVRVTMNMFFLTFCSIFCMLATPSWSQDGCSTSRHPTITLQNAETSKGSTLVLDLSLSFLNIYLFPWLLQGSVAACSIFDFCCSMQILSCST